MESSDAETGIVDCGVGTIVWVRRRNGSWWPGKILGADELPASHLMSPRSGTPVKLLGREDASVDWYNLEKSKRVKPFRCGEFDDCIERAEASQGMPPKKREKYARREDAILHALELEKQVVEKKYGKSNGLTLTTKSPGKDTSIIITPPELSRGGNGKHHVDMCIDDKRKGVSFQPRSGNNVVDDIKHKLSSLNHGFTPEHTVIVGGKKMSEKRKRSQEGNNNNNNNNTEGKRRDRHRPLVQVLESSPKLPLHSKEQRKVGDHTETVPEQVEISKSFPVSVSVPLNEDNNTTGSNEDTETDSSGTESLISDTYDALSDEGEDMEFIPKASEGKGADDESMSDDCIAKWQMKGKRKSRSLRKRKVPQWMTLMMMSNQGIGGYNNDSWDDDDDDVDGMRWMLIDVEVGVQSLGYQREHVPMISLMSKLNDKAIVGHPIPVEPLQDGSSLGMQSSLSDTKTPKSKGGFSHLSVLEEQQEKDDHDHDDDAGILKGKKPAVLKKPQRRTTSSSTTQKIRTLSSIGGTHQHQQSTDTKAAGEEGKPESLPTAVACIPVKLVFSRLHEELLVARHQ